MDSSADAWPEVPEDLVAMAEEIDRNTLDEDDFVVLVAGLEDPPSDMPNKKQKTAPSNACHFCGLQNKYIPPSGHLDLGWCPGKQAFTLRANKGANNQKTGCGEKLRDLVQDPLALENDEVAKAFIAGVRSSDEQAVRDALSSKTENRKMVKERRPDLLLVPVEGRARSVPSSTRAMWRWTAFSEASRCLPSTEPTEDSREARTLACLLEYATKMALELEHPQMLKSDSQSTAVHEAVYSGNTTAIEMLHRYAMNHLELNPRAVQKYKGQICLWAETRSGWLPFHSACIRHSPAYAQRETLLPRLIALMDEQLAAMKRILVAQGHAGAAGTSASAEQEADEPQLPRSAVHALSKVLPGKESAGPSGFNDKKGHNCDVTLLPAAPVELPEPGEAREGE